LDEHIETSKLVPNVLRRGDDRSLIRYVELEGVGVRADRVYRDLAALQIA
jgi:hypothetical protein